MCSFSMEHILQEGLDFDKKRRFTSVIRFVSLSFQQHRSLDYKEYKGKRRRIRL